MMQPGFIKFMESIKETAFDKGFKKILSHKEFKFLFVDDRVPEETYYISGSSSSECFSENSEYEHSAPRLSLEAVEWDLHRAVSPLTILSWLRLHSIKENYTSGSLSKWSQSFIESAAVAITESPLFLTISRIKFELPSDGIESTPHHFFTKVNAAIRHCLKDRLSLIKMLRDKEDMINSCLRYYRVNLADHIITVLKQAGLGSFGIHVTSDIHLALKLACCFLLAIVSGEHDSELINMFDDEVTLHSDGSSHKVVTLLAAAGYKLLSVTHADIPSQLGVCRNWETLLILMMLKHISDDNKEDFVQSLALSEDDNEIGTYFKRIICHPQLYPLFVDEKNSNPTNKDRLYYKLLMDMGHKEEIKPPIYEGRKNWFKIMYKMHNN